jgi:hypothetical protein
MRDSEVRGLVLEAFYNVPIGTGALGGRGLPPASLRPMQATKIGFTSRARPCVARGFRRSGGRAVAASVDGRSLIRRISL